MELIDKSAVVAEINKRLQANGAFDTTFDTTWSEDVGMCNAYKSILSFIETLEVKEVDLENTYKVDREIAREKSILDETKVEYFATGKPTIAAYSEDNLRNQFDAGADWMKEQIIKTFKEN